MRNDDLRKHHLLRGTPRHRARVGLFTFIFLSIALLALSRINHNVIELFRGRLVALAAPALEVISGPVKGLKRTWKNARIVLAKADELERLKLENQKLQQWKWRARQLENQVNAYAKIVQAVARPALGFVTGQVISEGRGPFMRSVLLNAGRKHGIRIGYPVVSAQGLTGRIVQAGDTASHVLLLSDLNSRIPVEIGTNRARAIMRGDNGASPRLTYISKGAKIAIGDEVFTSGQGGLLPRGLRIGKVAISGKYYRVFLHADLANLEYVSVLFFATPGVDIANQAEIPSRPERPGRPKRLEQPVASISDVKQPRDSAHAGKRSRR